MTLLAIACIVISIIACGLIPLAKEEGESVVLGCAITAMTMVLGYVVMIRVLDAMIGM